MGEIAQMVTPPNWLDLVLALALLPLVAIWLVAVLVMGVLRVGTGWILERRWR